MTDHNHHRVSPEGRSIGFQTARLVEPMVKDMVRRGSPDDRCKSCAGIWGTVPNGCLQTQADFIKAVSECVPFLCHVKVGETCFAWVAARLALGMKKADAPWEFSPPDDPKDAP